MSRQQPGGMLRVEKTDLVLDQIQREIEQTLDPRQAHFMCARAEAIRTLAQKSRQGVEVINKAVEIKIRALRRMAELLDQLRNDGVGIHGGYVAHQK